MAAVSSTSKKNHSVILVQRIIPEYRRDFFVKLDTCLNQRLSICAGEPQPKQAIVGAQLPSSVNFMKIRNRILFVDNFEVLVWQQGVIRETAKCRKSVIILENNLRIISNFVVILINKMIHNRIILWGHLKGKSKSRILDVIRNYLAGIADAVILYNQGDAEELVSKGIPRQKMFVAHNTIDTTKIKSLRQANNAFKKNSICYLGRLIPDKKVDLLLEALSSLKINHALSVNLEIIGDGPEMARLQKMSRDLGISHLIKFHGAVFSEDLISQAIRCCRASVSPGPIGLSAIHSLAYGLPVIFTPGEFNGPEAESLKSGYNALHFRADDPASLAQIINRLLTQPELQTELSQNAAGSVDERYSLDFMVEQFMAAIRYAQEAPPLQAHPQ